MHAVAAVLLLVEQDLAAWLVRLLDWAVVAAHAYALPGWTSCALGLSVTHWQLARTHVTGVTGGSYHASYSMSRGCGSCGSCVRSSCNVFPVAVQGRTAPPRLASRCCTRLGRMRAGARASTGTRWVREPVSAPTSTPTLRCRALPLLLRHAAPFRVPPAPHPLLLSPSPPPPDALAAPPASPRRRRPAAEPTSTCGCCGSCWARAGACWRTRWRRAARQERRQQEGEREQQQQEAGWGRWVRRGRTRRRTRPFGGWWQRSWRSRTTGRCAAWRGRERGGEGGVGAGWGRGRGGTGQWGGGWSGGRAVVLGGQGVGGGIQLGCRRL